MAPSTPRCPWPRDASPPGGCALIGPPGPQPGAPAPQSPGGASHPHQGPPRAPWGQWPPRARKGTRPESKQKAPVSQGTVREGPRHGGRGQAGPHQPALGFGKDLNGAKQIFTETGPCVAAGLRGERTRRVGEAGGRAPARTCHSQSPSPPRARRTGKWGRLCLPRPSCTRRPARPHTAVPGTPCRTGGTSQMAAGHRTPHPERGSPLPGGFCHRMCREAAAGGQAGGQAGTGDRLQQPPAGRASGSRSVTRKSQSCPPGEPLTPGVPGAAQGTNPQGLGGHQHPQCRPLRPGPGGHAGTDGAVVSRGPSSSSRPADCRRGRGPEGPLLGSDSHSVKQERAAQRAPEGPCATTNKHVGTGTLAHWAPHVRA